MAPEKDIYSRERKGLDKEKGREAILTGKDQRSSFQEKQRGAETGCRKMGTGSWGPFTGLASLAKSAQCHKVLSGGASLSPFLIP